MRASLRLVLFLAPFLVFGLASSASAQACAPSGAWSTAQNAWSDWDTVTYVYPTSSGTAFTMGHVCSTAGTCNDGRQFVLNASDPNYDAKLRVLMAAFLSGRQIRIYVDSVAPTSGCFVHIDRLMVR
ncbi:MAG: hypothetical protein AB8I08_09265 [Sandaracinaceae bacterium]